MQRCKQLLRYGVLFCTVCLLPAVCSAASSEIVLAGIGNVQGELYPWTGGV